MNFLPLEGHFPQTSAPEAPVSLFLLEKSLIP